MRDAVCALLPPAQLLSACRPPPAARGRRACARLADAARPGGARDAGCRWSGLSVQARPRRATPAASRRSAADAAPAAVPLFAPRRFFAAAASRTTDSVAKSEYASKFLPDEIRSAMIEGAEEQRTKIRVFPPPRKAREEGKDKKFFTWPHELKERYYEQYLAAEKMLAERRSAAVRPAEDGAGSEEPAGEAARWVAGADAETTAAGGANEWAAADVPAADEDVPVGPAVHALAARIGVVTPDIKNVAHVLQRTREGGRYSYLGRNALAMYVSEYLHMKYPLLPDHVMSRAITAYIGHAALATLGYEWGVNHAGKFEFLTDLTKLEEREVDCEIMADVVRGLVGVFAAHDAMSTRLFIHAHVLSRSLDVTSMIDFARARDHLVMLTRRQRKEPPTFRLLKESGRLTNCPIFVVGVFSGLNKLAEGFGSSLQMAKFRAARTALREHYATEVKDIQLPSDTLIEPGARYVAQPVGQTPADWRF